DRRHRFPARVPPAVAGHALPARIVELLAHRGGHPQVHGPRAPRDRGDDLELAPGNSRTRHLDDLPARTARQPEHSAGDQQPPAETTNAHGIPPYVWAHAPLLETRNAQWSSHCASR